MGVFQEADDEFGWGFNGVVTVRLMVWRGWVSERRDTNFLAGQDASG